RAAGPVRGRQADQTPLAPHHTSHHTSILARVLVALVLLAGSRVAPSAGGALVGARAALRRSLYFAGAAGWLGLGALLLRRPRTLLLLSRSALILLDSGTLILWSTLLLRRPRTLLLLSLDA